MKDLEEELIEDRGTLHPQGLNIRITQRWLRKELEEQMREFFQIESGHKVEIVYTISSSQTNRLV